MRIPRAPRRSRTSGRSPADRYKWTALANTTAAVFMSALDGVVFAFGAVLALLAAIASLLRGTGSTAATSPSPAPSRPPQEKHPWH
ncbi:hypothetical protein [Streptomyces sp. NPDC020917]|uniref:hypothetical protein n=1 Tax=Streptomyces sp. NPDC020917 TaxID=3365102 RepID=UPI0037AF7BB9